MRIFSTLLFILSLLLQLQPAHAFGGGEEYVDSRLLTNHSTVVPGQTIQLGWQANLADHWHIYWQNPGDSGLPPTITWQLPAGYEVTDFAYPTPIKLIFEPLVTYGYEGNPIFPLMLNIPADATVGEPISLRATVEYLVCKDICLPGSEEIAIDLLVGDTPVLDRRGQRLLEQAQAALPMPAPAQWYVVHNVANNTVRFNTGEQQPVEFYPFNSKMIVDLAEQTAEQSPSGWNLVVPANAERTDGAHDFSGVIRTEQGAYIISTDSLPQVTEMALEDIQILSEDSSSSYSNNEQKGLILVLLFALLAGLVLNLMPCVLPVLALKGLSLVKLAHSGQAFRHAIAYTAGILITFWALAVVILAFRQAGMAFGWGFHLQNSGFVAALALLLVALGLNFVGVFTLGNSLSNLGSKNKAAGLHGSFLSGILITLVATPCTVPFMGTAVGYALTQPAAVTLSVFSAMALGLALPLLFVTVVPGGLKWLPKPGPWLTPFKQLLAFPLFATAVWLWWVWEQQRGSMAGLILLSTMLLLAFTVWLFGRINTLQASKLRQLIGWVVLLGGLALSWAIPVYLAPHDSKAGVVKHSVEMAVGKWSTAAVTAAQAEGRPVFVNFTADWCITCKVNENITLKNSSVQTAFANNDVAYLVGDWTNNDPLITAELQRFERSGVPLYLYYAPGATEPQILPQLLTPTLVLDILN